MSAGWLDELDGLEHEAEEASASPEVDGDLVERLRGALRRQNERLRQAHEDGRAAGKDEAHRDIAWERAGVPESMRSSLFAGVDPRDTAAVEGRAAELRGQGIRWGDDPGPDGQVDLQAEKLGRMEGTSAGALSSGDGDRQRAAAIKRRVDRGDGESVSEDDREFFGSWVSNQVDRVTEGGGY
jgi:hypothetical protein